MISRTSTSGAEAPAVMPMRADVDRTQFQADLARTLHQHGRFGSPKLSATSTRRTELELFGEPTTISRDRKRARSFDGVLAVGCGVANIVLRRDGDARKPLLKHLDDGRVSSTESVV